MNKERKTFKEKWNYFVYGYETCAICGKGIYNGSVDYKKKEYYCDDCYYGLPADENGKPVPLLCGFEMHGISPLQGYMMIFVIIAALGSVWAVKLLESIK